MAEFRYKLSDHLKDIYEVAFGGKVLESFSFKKIYKITIDDGTIAIDSEGNTITYSDVELFYGDPFKPQKLDHTFWWNFETSMDKIDDQQINYFFGRDGVKILKDVQKMHRKY